MKCRYVGELATSWSPAAGFIAQVGLVALTSSISSGLLADCIARPDETSSVKTQPGPVSGLPLASASSFEYAGGFALPADTFGESSLNFAEAIIEVSGNSLFIVGHVNDDAVAEFIIPELADTTTLSELPLAGPPVQNFARILNRAGTGNPDSIDTITGMEIHDGNLIINGIEYYDGSADNRDTTLVLSDAGDLVGSKVTGFLELPGAAKIAGWMSEMPEEWQAELGTSHLIGHSSGPPVIGRHSVGPSFYSVDADELVSASPPGAISVENLLGFSLEEPLAEDLYNESRQNDLWTIDGGAKFGFIVPGTRTYATFGSIEGIESGLGYKITQNDGNLCGGPCPYDAKDAYNYYWLWDMNDLLEVRDGQLQSHDVRPYAYGKFEVPFQTASNGHNQIGGGSYDAATNTLYFSVKEAHNEQGRYDNPPVIVAYRIKQP